MIVVTDYYRRRKGATCERQVLHFTLMTKPHLQTCRTTRPSQCVQLHPYWCLSLSFRPPIIVLSEHAAQVYQRTLRLIAANRSLLRLSRRATANTLIAIAAPHALTRAVSGCHLHPEALRFIKAGRPEALQLKKAGQYHTLHKSKHRGNLKRLHKYATSDTHQRRHASNTAQQQCPALDIAPCSNK